MFTAAQADRAATLFDERCNVCHGGAMAPELFGDRFNQRWDGLSLNDLFELIRTTMPQDDPGSLLDQQYVDIIAYLLNGGGFPAGPAELLPVAADLAGIVFRAAEDGAPPTARP